MFVTLVLMHFTAMMDYFYFIRHCSEVSCVGEIRLLYIILRVHFRASSFLP